MNADNSSLLIMCGFGNIITVVVWNDISCSTICTVRGCTSVTVTATCIIEALTSPKPELTGLTSLTEQAALTALTALASPKPVTALAALAAALMALTALIGTDRY